MAYTTKDFRTKKELITAVKSGERVTCYSPGLGPMLDAFTGEIALEGPHYPKPHSWYAVASLVDGVIVRVR